MTWTSHGWWLGPGMQPSRVRRLDCGGPHQCPTCALEAQRANEDTGRLSVPVTVALGLEPEPRKLIAALRIIAGRARQCRDELAAIPEDSAPLETAMEALGIIARHSDGCADDLEQQQAGEDEQAQRRADDDGWPQRE